MCDNNENMKLYNEFRKCPAEAQKPITAGRLKGKTDINPMWRIKKLTEVFGPCGIGWTLRIVRTWVERGAEKVRFNSSGEIIERNSELSANVEIALRIKYNGEWSEDIPGIGGAMFVELESKGFNTEDEAFKKAYTDAISVSCKQLGIAADIYFSKDPDSKYQTDPMPSSSTSKADSTSELPFPEVGKSPIPEDINEARQWAVNFIVSSGTRAGMKLGEIRKLDKAAYSNLMKAPPSAECAAAIKIINDWVNGQ